MCYNWNIYLLNNFERRAYALNQKFNLCPRFQIGGQLNESQAQE
jgi:hypothetical protein